MQTLAAEVGGAPPDHRAGSVVLQDEESSSDRSHPGALCCFSQWGTKREQQGLHSWMCLQSLTKTDNHSPLKKAISAAPLKWALKFYEATTSKPSQE